MLAIRGTWVFVSIAGVGAFHWRLGQIIIHAVAMLVVLDAIKHDGQVSVVPFSILNVMDSIGRLLLLPLVEMNQLVKRGRWVRS
ncbi:hypothetical protein BDP55DRAFT_747257 [Colletotrichum godetiae]|uniref:Uncharacterized protein n=1 Tax=Colletotrichum godetiae TaxID=1209918 RepID=A0AAJ0ALT4_9PEZI|nr:uncharacterized protein BDP55DRAFT_747257 [Colletotrichum godetiae]KAK1674041.1 hypothetical protein BDP55DRAFT_747257 [Colletotrichum godetiae]